MTQDISTTRRTVIRAGLGLVAVGVAASAAHADDKLAQDIVQYQKTPKDGAFCSKCVNWEAPNGCKIVAGTISPTGWCVAFAPKEG